MNCARGKGAKILSAGISMRSSHPDPSSRPAMWRGGEALSDGDMRAIAPPSLDRLGRRERVDGGAAQTEKWGEEKKNALGVRASL